MTTSQTKSITLTKNELNELLVECARLGAHNAVEDFARYRLKDACTILNISYPTLYRRVLEGKIKAVDGMITGKEIRKYLGFTNLKE